MQKAAETAKKCEETAFWQRALAQYEVVQKNLRRVRVTDRRSKQGASGSFRQGEQGIGGVIRHAPGLLAIVPQLAAMCRKF